MNRTNPNRIWIASLIILILMSGTATSSFADIFGGVDFPDGARSFADRLIETVPGNPAATDPDGIDPTDALGPPDYVDPKGAVSLGRGGSITLMFQDNSLTGSGDTAYDLWVFEVGPDVEDTFVEISMDGLSWHSVGKVTGGTRGINIDAYGWGTDDAFTYVRLTDDPNEGGSSGASVGADIDALGALSSGPGNPPSFGATEWIVFSYKEHEADAYDLWMIRPNGEWLARITNTPDVNESQPVISPDGKWIAHKKYGFPSIDKDGIYCISCDTTTETCVVTRSQFPPPANQVDGPVWMDDEWIAFTVGMDGVRSIYKTSLLTSEVDFITTLALALGSGGKEGFVTDISPDRSRFVLCAEEDFWTPTFDLYLMNTDGTNGEMLYGDSPDNFIDNSAKWSPLGNAIAFAHDYTGDAYSDPRHYGVVLMDPITTGTIGTDGVTGLEELTSRTAFCIIQDWSPPGDRICYFKADDYGYPSPMSDLQGDLWIAQANGALDTQITYLDGWFRASDNISWASWGNMDTTPTLTVYAWGMEDPQEISFDSRGILYAGHSRNASGLSIYRIMPGGGKAQEYGGGAFSDPDGLDVDATDNVYVASGLYTNVQDGEAKKINPAGAVSNVGNNYLRNPTSLLLDRFDRFGEGMLISQNVVGKSQIRHIALNGTSTLIFETTSTLTMLDLCYNSLGTLWFAGGDHLYSWEQGGDVEEREISGFSGAVHAVGYDPFEHRMIVGSETKKVIFHINSSGVFLKNIASGIYPRDFAFDSSGNIYVSDEVNDVIWRIERKRSLTDFKPATWILY